MTRSCSSCRNNFEAKTNGKYCSKECYSKAHPYDPERQSRNYKRSRENAKTNGRIILTGPGKRNCAQCGVEFLKQKNSSKYCSDECKKKTRSEKLRTRLSDPGFKEKFQTWHKFYRLQKGYGLSREDYENMLSSQGGVCAICMEHEKQLCVDHDHSTQKVRGLLCHDCNRAIGLLRESEANMNRAIAYLKENRL